MPWAIRRIGYMSVGRDSAFGYKGLQACGRVWPVPLSGLLYEPVCCHDFVLVVQPFQSGGIKPVCMGVFSCEQSPPSSCTRCPHDDRLLVLVRQERKAIHDVNLELHDPSCDGVGRPRKG